MHTLLDVKVPQTKDIFACTYLDFSVHIILNATLWISYDDARTIHPWCDGCQTAFTQSPKLALYDLSCRLRSLLSLSWKLQIVLLQNTKYLKYEMQNRFMTNRGGMLLAARFMAISCFYETLKSAKSGPSKAFYKDEMAEQSGCSSLKVVKSFFTEIQLSGGGLCNRRKLILKMKMNLISIKQAIDAGPARWLYTHKRERERKR